MKSKMLNDYGSINPCSDDEFAAAAANATSSTLPPNSRHGFQRNFVAMLLFLVGMCFVLMEMLSANGPNTSIDLTSSLLSRISGTRHNHKNSKNTHRNDPIKALYFKQVVDHHHPSTSGTFRQRYYENQNYWKGPGHPIFFIFGGEGPLERILYPFISEVLAEDFGAVTVNLEHRFFGVSFPTKKYSKKNIAKLLTPQQALQDAIAFIQSKQKELGCGPRWSPSYCPVMTVGGSYAGLLSTLARKVYPDTVDMAYAASPCLLLFGHTISPYTYYEYITEVADRISPGCPDAVRGTMEEMQLDVASTASPHDLRRKAKHYGICEDLPGSIKTAPDLAHKIIEYTSSNFAETNMDYYPPTPDQKFFQGCAIFENETRSAQQRVKDYIQMITDSSDCYTLPEEQKEGDLWDALCCYLVPMIGKSDESMWPEERYSLSRERKDCEQEFGIIVDPEYLNNEFGLSNLTGVTHLLLTNGYNDGRYPTSYVHPIPNNTGVVVMSMETGAHHSDLTHQLQEDTLEVTIVHSETRDIVAAWLEQPRSTQIET